MKILMEVLNIQPILHTLRTTSPSSAMEYKLTVDEITSVLADWTCKIQVVDKFLPQESKDHTVHFQIIIVEDENEQQNFMVLYDDDIYIYIYILLYKRELSSSPSTCVLHVILL